MALDAIGSRAELNEILLAESRGVVLSFSRTWCQPCRTLRPHLETLAEDFAEQWRIVSADAEESADLADAFEVEVTPTLIYMKGGEEVHRSAGAVTPSNVAAALSTHAKPRS